MPARFNRHSPLSLSRALPSHLILVEEILNIVNLTCGKQFFQSLSWQLFLLLGYISDIDPSKNALFYEVESTHSLGSREVEVIQV